MDRGKNKSMEYDVNGLNEESIQWAKYYYCIFAVFHSVVNNKEVKKYKKIYDYIIFCHKDNTPITANDLSVFLHTRPFPLYRHIVTLNDEGGADWNTFFQLSLLFSFAPSVAIFYFLVCTTPDYNGKITLSNILYLLTLIKNRSGGEETVTSLFKLYDKNRTGSITTNQFFQLVTKHLEIWVNLFRTRENLLKRMLSINEVLVILERKRNINNIKNYQSKHFNRLPPRSCLNYIKDLFQNKVNPCCYDYNDIDDSITLSSLITSLIKKYNSNYKITEYEKMNLFNVKYFKFKNKQLFPIPSLLPIDNFYSFYPEFQKRLSLSKNNSTKSMMDNNNNNNNYRFNINTNNNNNNNNNPPKLRSSVSAAVVAGYNNSFLKQRENSQKYPVKSSLSHPHFVSNHPSRAASFADNNPNNHTNPNSAKNSKVGIRQSCKDLSNYHPGMVTYNSPLLKCELHKFRNDSNRPVARSCGFATDYSPALQKKLLLNVTNSPSSEYHESINSRLINVNEKLEQKFSCVEEATESTGGGEIGDINNQNMEV